jgi:hypothetical protein
MNVNTMPETYKLIVDTHSVVYDLLRPLADDEFWEFSTFDPPQNSICVIGRRQFVDNLEKIKRLADQGHTIVFDNAAEGSETLHRQIGQLNIQPLLDQKKILLLSGGDMDPSYTYLLHDHFINVILGYEYNCEQMHRINEIYSKKLKPYKFLFLNGRARPHRQYLWEKLKQHQLLDTSLCTMLEGNEIKQLPPYYEFEQYQNNQVTIESTRLIKHDMFNNTWGEIYAKCEPYIDSYFSLVTETVVDCPYSFRTEKIDKPLLLGHPWIAVANKGFYRDIKNLGFRTFDHLIDESFDQIDNTQDRLDRIITIVADLCQQDLASFIDSCYSVCKYNQIHLQEYRSLLRREFPHRFLKYINERS